MFCSSCGKQLPDESAFCSACGANLKAVTQNDRSDDEAEEKIIMQGVCNRVKSAMNVQNGKAMLTNQRFIYLKHNVVATLAIGALVNLASGTYEFDIPLSDIESIEDGRQGVSKTIIINTKSGERYNFYFHKREEWKIAIQNAVRKGV